jgi:hypothetical protein
MKAKKEHISSQETNESDFRTSLSDAVKIVDPSILQTIELIQKMNPPQTVTVNPKVSYVGTN